MRRFRFALVLAVALPATLAGAGPASGTAGEPVRAFGTSGRVRDVRPDCEHERFIDQLASPDGGASVLVYTWCGDTTAFHLARYRPDGGRDATFGGDGRAELDPDLTDGIPQGHVRYADGSYAVLGASTDGVVSVTKVGSAGTVVEDHGTGGTSLLDLGDGPMAVIAAEARADGGLVAVVTNEFSTAAPRLVHVTPDGDLDTAFDGDGVRLLTAEAAGVPGDAVIRDGAVLTAGPSDHDRTHLSIRRYDAAGTPDAAFGGDGHVLVEAWQNDTSWVRVAWAPDRSVYAAFSAPFVENERPVAALSVVRLGADGGHDVAYGDLGAARVSFGGRFDRVSDVLVDDAGRVVLSAERQPLDHMRVARFAAGTGEIDHSFGDAGVQEVHFTPHLAGSDGVVQLAGGDLLVTGDVVVADPCCLGDTDIGLARLHSSVPHPERFVSIDPVRILDTRAGGGAVAAGTSRTVSVLGVRTVPATGVNAVVVNVTVVGATSGGYLTVYEAGRPRPATSNVNFARGDTVANLATVKVGDGGALSVFLGGGSAHVLLDVAGYYTDGTAPSAGAGFVPVPPARLLDTRPGRLAGDGAEAAVGPHGTLRLKVAGRGGVPATGVTAVVMTVTAVTPTASGFVTAWPAGPRPTVSNLNFARRTTANLVTVKVDAEGFVSLFNSNGTTHLLADVAGYYDPASARTARVVTARRGYDTRRTLAFRPGETRAIGPDLYGIPARPGRAVVLNLTVTGATAGTFLTVHPHGSPRPLTSNVNVSPGRTVAVQVVAPASEGGFVSVYNALGSVHVVVDYQGWFA